MNEINVLFPVIDLISVHFKLYACKNFTLFMLLDATECTLLYKKCTLRYKK